MGKIRRDRPGYQYRLRSDGTRAQYWNPRRAYKKAPDYLETRAIPDDADDAEIVALCRQWTDELIGELAHLNRPLRYDGTIHSLVALYKSEEESPYHRLKPTTRKRDYDPILKVIDETVGARAIRELSGADFRRWFSKWGSPGKDGKPRPHRAHNSIRKLRTVFSFGVEQKYADCRVAREILSLIRFEAPAPRKVKMTFEHACAIVEEALELGRPSIALTQALQWDTGLRRIDIIGQWLPAREGEGGIIRGKTRWHGPAVSVISKDLILSIAATSKTGAESIHDLKLCPLTMRVLRDYKLPEVGPLIVSEKTRIPYRENYYATEWREIAAEADVPAEIWSMDSRAGAISEVEEATGNLDSARKFATHTNAKTTLRYVRNDVLDSNRATALARQKLRK